jgi:integrase
MLPKLIDQYNKQHPSTPLRRIRLHDLRHIHATTLLLAGVPVHMVAVRLGHADPSVTLRVYAHVIQELTPAVAATFDGAVEAAIRGQSGAIVSNGVSEPGRVALPPTGKPGSD